MRTLFVTDPPPTVEDWLVRRRALGQDLFDEVWEGEYHVAAAPTGRHADVQVQLVRILAPAADRVGLRILGPITIGTSTDFRVPDLSFVRGDRDLTWHPTAAIVVEVVSVGDESRQKSDFYHRAGVEELLIVDPDAHTTEWFERGPDAFRPSDGSTLLSITSTELTAAIDWPA